MGNGVLKFARLYKPERWRQSSWFWRIAMVILTLFMLLLVSMYFASRPPAPISARAALIRVLPADKLDDKGRPKVVKTGAALTAMTIHIINSLQHKFGGYTRNDVTPPGVLMDNMPAWEYGVLRNARDISKAFRNQFSMMKAGSTIDDDLKDIENNLSYQSTKWMFPSPETSYARAADALLRYFNRIIDDDSDAQFYARADNLRIFLTDYVSINLESYAQRLSQSVGAASENMGLAGAAPAQQNTGSPQQLFKKTPWYRVDDIFYEARGYAWALLQEMRAIRVDFTSVLVRKNAMAYIDQIIRELEASQKTVWSPIILNGSGFGMMTNHSLVLASYLSRAETMIIRLAGVLETG